MKLSKIKLMQKEYSTATFFQKSSVSFKQHIGKNTARFLSKFPIQWSEV